MSQLSLRTSFYLALDVALLGVCFLHVPYVTSRAKVPWTAVSAGSVVMVDRVLDAGASGGLRPGDTLVAIEGYTVRSAYDGEFHADKRSIGMPLGVTVSRSGMRATLTTHLTPFYATRYTVVNLLVGLVTWIVSVFVLLARPRDLTARILHLALLSMAVSTMLPMASTPPGAAFPFLARGLFFLIYMNVAASLVLFTSLFPKPKQGPFLRKLLVLFTPLGIFVAGVAAVHLRALATSSLEDYALYRTLFHLYHLVLLALVLLGVVNFLHSFQTTDSPVERKKLKWILWGLAIGPAPFMFLITLPEFFVPVSPVPEEFALLFLVLIPVAFAISFIRYHVLDVEIVINRTTVYALVLGFIVAVYLAVVGVAAWLVGSYTEGTYAVAAVLVALLFEPARGQVQRFVDRRFFRVQYDFRIAVREFMERMKRCVTLDILAQVIVRETDALIPVEKIGFFTLRQPGNRLRCVVHKGYELLERRGVRFEQEKLKTALDVPVALNDCVEPGIRFEPADEHVFRRWGMVVVFPMISLRSGFLGFLVLGEKRSGARFTAEDVDLLTNVATQAGLEIERITLQREVLMKEEEARQLAELNQLKSDFVSYVSHEFRTPLTSIKMYSELLEAKTIPLGKKSREYLRVIQGEADRLERMVSTVLDSAKIDQGVKHYKFERTDLRAIADGVMEAMDYQMKKYRFAVQYSRGRRPLPFVGDADAAGQAMTNILSNAVKYSGERRVLKVSLKGDRNWVTCTVADRGQGIPAESLPHIFQKFYRDPSHSGKVQGVGLGLPLVKHILDAHGGTVEVASTVGKGTTVTLRFPVSGPENGSAKKNTDH